MYLNNRFDNNFKETIYEYRYETKIISFCSLYYYSINYLVTSSVILYYIGREAAVENCNEKTCKSNNFDVQSNSLYQLGILGCLIIICVYISIKDMLKCRKLNVNIRKNR